jgi:hypothetical protein
VKRGIAWVNPNASELGDVMEEGEWTPEPGALGDRDLVAACGDGGLTGNLLGSHHVFKREALVASVDEQDAVSRVR